MNDFRDMWSEISDKGGHDAGRFRVAPDHVLDFFVTFSLGNKRVFLLETTSEAFGEQDLPVFENIALERTDEGDKTRISLNLEDEDFGDLFNSVCFDLVRATAEQKVEEAAVAVFVNRLLRWVKLLKQSRGKGWSFSKFLGVFGELLTLRWMMTDLDVTPELAIRSWRGPDGDSTDFGLERVRFEVKSQRSTNAKVINVSSLDQLSESERHLFVVHNRILPSEEGLSMVSLVEEIRELLGREELQFDFMRKLLLAEFAPEADFVEENYRLDIRTIYEVHEGFPRLTSENVNMPAIKKVSYEINCDLISDFETDEERIALCL